MQRRNFIQSITTATFYSPLISSICFGLNAMETDNLLPIFIKEHDKRVEKLLTNQELKENHPFFGGFPDRFEIYHPSSAASVASHFITAYISPTSTYYQAPLLQKRLKWSLDFLLERQHPSGRIDLLTTNFDSAPDTAFAMEPLCRALLMLRKWAPDALPDFQKKAKEFLLKAGEGVRVGGMHTPNHRWVICRALAMLHTLFPNSSYTDRIYQWLDEGIDIDPDGQFNEKSSAGYTPMVDHCLITIARLIDRPELYEPVRKNLDMMLYQLHANGEVVTEVSKRQDQFRIAKMGRYYYAYRYMALLDKNPVYAAMVDLIEQSVGIPKLYGNLAYFLEDASLNLPLPKIGQLPTNYVKHFPFSKMLRIRREEVDATILGDNYTFFTFFKGNAALQAVRLASAFFGKGQFTSPSLKIEDGKYILSQSLTGPYYQPHLKENIAPDGDWEKMPRKIRPQSEIQYYTSNITIEEQNGQFSIHFDIKGTDHVPVAIELAFRSGGQLKGVSKVPDTEGIFILENGYGQYKMDKDAIEFGPGLKNHAWTQLRGAKPKLNGDSVYLTGYTPFDFTLTIK